MDYEKKYKEALERMKSWARGEHPECFAEAQKAAEFIFPELAESEDERIRKLCEILVRTCFMNELCTKEEKNDCIAWLEKQESVGEIVERCKTSWYNEGKIQGQIEGLSDEEKYQQGWHDALEEQGQEARKVSIWKHWKDGIAGNGNGEPIFLIKNGNTYTLSSVLSYECDYIELSELNNLMLEKQGKQKPAEWHKGDEQNLNACLGYIPDEYLRRWLMDVIHVKYDKPTDKVEPKFHKGQWIAWQDKCYKVNYNGCGYELFDKNGLSILLDYGTIDENAHLWDVAKDAKNGDVLVDEDNNIGIYKEIEGICWHSYFYLGCNNHLYGFSIGGSHVQNNTKPATKEQRDLLFQKMKEAGYMWDAEKKELKKIEDENYDGEDYGIDSLFHAQRILEKTLGKVDGYQTDDGILSHKCAITAVNKLYKQKSAWSEEDECYMSECIGAIATKDGWSFEEKRKTKHWLESLKDRYAWKPSNEQMKALHHLNLTGNISYAGQGQTLIELYNDLKKLREE